METLYIPVTVLVLLVALAWYRWRVRTRFRTPPVRVRPKLMLDEAGVAMLGGLRDALPDHHVFPAVSYAAFLAPRDKLGDAESTETRALLQACTADFLICHPSMQVVAVMRRSGRTRGTDTEAEALLREAAIPVLRHDPATPINAAEVRETIHELETLSAVRVESAPPASQPAGETRRAAARAAVQRDRQEPRL